MHVNLLEVADLAKTFPLKSGGVIHAVDGVSFTLAKGETIGIVGESGCGKSTLGRLILQLIKPTSGDVRFLGKQLTLLPDGELRKMRRHMQMVFQNPFASLDARMQIGAQIEEPLLIHKLGTKTERVKQVAQLLETVGLPANAAQRYPHEFSGGQRQRICIARALILHPELIIADEAVSALDVSIQSQILNLLMDLKRDFGLSYLFISHNLAVVKYMSDTVAVMYLGRIVEIGPAEDVYAQPRHPYTQALIAAIPQPDPSHTREGVVVSGDLPSPESPPSGCRFHPRCQLVMDKCRVETPKPIQLGTKDRSHIVECHLYA